MNYFTKLPKRNTNDHTRWTVSDDAPSWVSDAVQDAHDGDCPDDWSYDICRLFFNECTDPFDDEFIHEFADGCVNIYTQQLARWYVDHCLSGVHERSNTMMIKVRHEGDYIEVEAYDSYDDIKETNRLQFKQLQFRDLSMLSLSDDSKARAVYRFLQINNLRMTVNYGGNDQWYGHSDQALNSVSNIEGYPLRYLPVYEVSHGR